MLRHVSALAVSHLHGAAHVTKLISSLQMVNSYGRNMSEH